MLKRTTCEIIALMKAYPNIELWSVSNSYFLCVSRDLYFLNAS